MTVMSPILFLALFFTGVAGLWWLSRQIVREADSGRTARPLSEGGLEFAADQRAFLAMYIFLGVFAVIGVGGTISALISHASLLFPLVCLGFTLLLLRVLPGTIVLSTEGLEQRFWLAKVTRIGWSQVREIAVRHEKGLVTIRSKSGTKIEHTRQLPDRARLLAELEARCPEKMPRPVEIRSETRTVMVPPPPPPPSAPIA
jgi:hypothetical protein